MGEAEDAVAGGVDGVSAAGGAGGCALPCGLDASQAVAVSVVGEVGRFRAHAAA